MAAHELDQHLRELLPGMQRFALWLTHDAGAADDLVQIALERALRRWSSRHGEAELRPWLFAILHNEFLDSRRRSRRYTGLLERLRAEPAVQPSVEREVIAQSTLEAFERLPLEQRNLLWWVSIEGLSYREIAAILQVPIGTVMSRLSRAREALRRHSDGQAATQPHLRLLK